MMDLDEAYKAAYRRWIEMSDGPTQTIGGGMTPEAIDARTDEETARMDIGLNWKGSDADLRQHMIRLRQQVRDEMGAS